MNLKQGLGIALLAAISAQGATLDHTGWFTFHMPWNDTSKTITDQSWSVEAPAGKHGFLQTTPEGHFRFQNAPGRVRFSGFVNVTSSNYPDSADAPLIAGRLRKLGTNFLRIHLVDNDWGNALYPAGTQTMKFEPARLRKMDWFLKCLRDQGVYYNFCVQSAHVFKEGDTIPAPITNEQGKIVSLFDPRLIQLQKRWAASLAEHVNPYTNLAYKDDPALISWELTNENQLFMGWLSWGSYSHWDSTTATNSVGMHPYYYRRLDTLWNRWLATRYRSDSALATAWTGRTTESGNQVANPSFESGMTGWLAWYDPKSTAEITSSVVLEGKEGRKALSLAVLSKGTRDYDASVNYSGLSVTAGKSYRLRFWVKGSVATNIRAEFLKEATWDWYGDKNCDVGIDWSMCEAFLTAPVDLDGDLRFNIDVGLSTGTILVDSASFQEYGGDGLRGGESMAAYSVKRSSRSTLGSQSLARTSDEQRFYASVEADYMDALGGFLKDSLKIKVPVTFTNNWYGLPSIASQAKADYMDAHWYWDHPSFPDGWSDVNFRQHQKPMVKDPGWGTVPYFSASRVKGKPFMASEYNHPWPNQYQCEAAAFYYGYMGFLDADGALLHAYYDGDPLYKSSFYRMFFNSGMNPLLVTQQHLARLFRMGAVTPASDQATIDVTESDLAASAAKLDGPPFSGSIASSLVRPTRWGSFQATTSTPTNFVDPGTRARSNTGELDWDKASGILRIDNSRWQGLVGFLGTVASTTGIGTTGLKTTAGRDFSAVHLVSADSQTLADSRRLLLLTSARMENPSTTWATDFTRTTRQYSSTDSLICEPVTGIVWMLPGRRDSVSVYPLDPMGNRKPALGVSWSTDTLRFALPGGTLWYEIAKGDAASPVGVRTSARKGAALGLRTTTRGWMLDYEAPAGTRSPRLEWSIRRLDGQTLAKGSHLGISGRLSIAAPVGSGSAILEACVRGEQGTVARARSLAPVAR